jgi:WD40 repeat protein
MRGGNMSRYPWRDTSEDIAKQSESQWETPAGAQEKADKALDDAKEYTDEQNQNFNDHIENTVIHVTQNDKDRWNNHIEDTVKHLTSAEHTKLTNIQDGAEVNQNAFAVIKSPGRNDVNAKLKQDYLNLVGGTGIAITTNEVTNAVTFSATGEALPGPHGGSHNIIDGSDPIPDLVQLREDFDNLTPSEIGAETPTGAQEKVDLAKSSVETMIGNIDELETSTKSNLVVAINEVFQSVGNGKTLIADAITDKGVPTSATDTFGQMATNIEAIETGGEITGETLEQILLATSVTKGDPVGIRTIYTKLADPLVMPDSTTVGVGLTPDGSYLAVSNNASPFLYIYKRNGDSWTKLPNPSVLPQGQCQVVSFSSDGLYMFTHSSSSTPHVNIYKRSGDTFTKLNQPNIQLNDVAQTMYDMGISSDGVYLATTSGYAPTYGYVYKRTGDTFTQLTINGGMPTVTTQSVALSPDGSYLFLGSISTPYMYVYKRTGDTYNRISISLSPDFSPYPRMCRFSPDGKFFICGANNTPSVRFVYQIKDELLEQIFAFGGTWGQGVSFDTTGTWLTVGAYDGGLIPYKFKNGTTVPRKSVTPLENRIFQASISTDYMAVTAGAIPFLYIYKISSQAVKIDNTYEEMIESDKLGYAKEDGVAGETKEIAIIWEG